METYSYMHPRTWIYFEPLGDLFPQTICTARSNTLMKHRYSTSRWNEEEAGFAWMSNLGWIWESSFETETSLLLDWGNEFCFAPFIDSAVTYLMQKGQWGISFHHRKLERLWMLHQHLPYRSHPRGMKFCFFNAVLCHPWLNLPGQNSSLQGYASTLTQTHAVGCKFCSSCSKCCSHYHVQVAINPVGGYILGRIFGNEYVRTQWWWWVSPKEVSYLIRCRQFPPDSNFFGQILSCLSLPLQNQQGFADVSSKPSKKIF